MTKGPVSAGTNCAVSNRLEAYLKASYVTFTVCNLLSFIVVGDELVSSIGRGVCVLVGISNDDTPKDMEYM